MPGMRATSPKRSSAAPPPLPLVLPEYPSRRKPTARKMSPGTTERWICRGGAGLPDSAVTIGTFVIARAGRDAAKYVATTASTSEATTTSQGKAQTPIR